MGEEDRRCGVGSLKQNACLQKCGTLLAYCLVAGPISFLTTAVYSYMSAVQSTSQTAFSFSSTDIGVWYALFEVGSILSNILTSYFLTNKHIPNVLTIGVVIVMIGTLMHGLPQLFVDYQQKVKATSGGLTALDHIQQSLCQNRADLETTTVFSLINTTSAAGGPERMLDEATTSHTFVLILYCIGGFFMGAGFAPFWSLGLVYIDNNVRDVHDTTFYVGILLVCYTIGPVIGFASAGWFLNYYVTLEETYLTPDSAQWIGAYWIGYFMFTALLTLFVLPMSMFPKRLPFPVETDDEMQTKRSQDEVDKNADADDGSEVIEKDNIRSFKGLLPALGRLFTNPLYVLEILGSCAGVYYISGWVGFLPKYFEEHFYFTASQSSIYAGALPPLISCIGVFAGGYLNTKYKLSLQRNTLVLFLTLFVACLLLVPMFFLHCKQFPVAEPPINSTGCVQQCGCNEKAYVPVCHEGTTYKTPCLVGCDNHTKIGDEIQYFGCFCDMNVTMSDGVCKEDNCYSPYIYIVFGVLSLTFSVMASSAAVSIILRSTNEMDRSLALGVQSSTNSLLAWIPAPILYGTLIDSTCTIWEYPDDPDWKGYCMEYDNVAYRHKYLGVTVGSLALTCVFLGLAIPVSYMKRYMKPERDHDEVLAKSEMTPL